jgi:hypothetical protein
MPNTKQSNVTSISLPSFFIIKEFCRTDLTDDQLELIGGLLDFLISTQLSKQERERIIRILLSKDIGTPKSASALGTAGLILLNKEREYRSFLATTLSPKKAKLRRKSDIA